MHFDEKKLGVEAIDQLFQCEISTVEPFALMLAPVYVYMKLNQKLVSVKAPLDFFTPDELKQLSRYEHFYIPKFVQYGARFQTAAKLVRNMLTSGNSEKLPPANYELSNEVIKILTSLWGKDLSIDPFYSAIFADELCGSFDSEKMLAARNLTVARHDSGILLAGLVIFVLLHLGWYGLSELSEVRNIIYDAIVDRDENWSEPTSEWQSIARDLKEIISSHLWLNPNGLSECSSEWAHRMLGRIERIQKTPSLKSYPSLHFSEEQESSA